LVVPPFKIYLLTSFIQVFVVGVIVTAQTGVFSAILDISSVSCMKEWVTPLFRVLTSLASIFAFVFWSLGTCIASKVSKSLIFSFIAARDISFACASPLI
jgi:hypothetical protein